MYKADPFFLLDLHFDRLGKDFLLLGKGERQDTVGELAFDLVLIDSLGQAEGTLELPIDSLPDKALLSIDVLEALLVAGDCQNVLVNVDFDFILLVAGKLRFNDIALLGLIDIHRRIRALPDSQSPQRSLNKDLKLDTGLFRL